MFISILIPSISLVFHNNDITRLWQIADIDRSPRPEALYYRDRMAAKIIIKIQPFVTSCFWGANIVYSVDSRAYC